MHTAHYLLDMHSCKIPRTNVDSNNAFDGLKGQFWPNSAYLLLESMEKDRLYAYIWYLVTKQTFLHQMLKRQYRQNQRGGEFWFFSDEGVGK